MGEELFINEGGRETALPRELNNDAHLNVTTRGEAI
jgi:hypothetical protein